MPGGHEHRRQPSARAGRLVPVTIGVEGVDRGLPRVQQLRVRRRVRAAEPAQPEVLRAGPRATQARPSGPKPRGRADTLSTIESTTRTSSSARRTSAARSAAGTALAAEASWPRTRADSRTRSLELGLPGGARGGDHLVVDAPEAGEVAGAAEQLDRGGSRAHGDQRLAGPARLRGLVVLQHGGPRVRRRPSSGA